MSAFLVLDAVSARAPDRRLLFSGLSLSVSAERVGVVGRNGAGKSTLLRIASGVLLPASGTVRRSGTVGILGQDCPETASLAEALGISERLAAIRRVLDGGVASEEPDWSLPARIDAALAEAGLSGLDTGRPIGTLSGGERMRAGIAGLRLAAPDLLLLDEPTNTLDGAGREAIASLLRAHRGGVLVASHDRALLDGMDRILALSPTGIRIVGGGWSAFAAVREAERQGAVQASERAEAALSQARRTAQEQREMRERRDRAGRAEAARGSVPAIALGRRAERAQNSSGRVRLLGERMVAGAEAEAARARAGVEPLVPLDLSLPPCLMPPGYAVLRMRDASLRRGGRRLGPWTLSLDGAVRVAVTGGNGAGKSTLLHLAAGLLQPDSGSVCGHRVALLDQHAALPDAEATVLANLQRLHPSLGEREARARCARFGFRNRDAERRVRGLSGGERVRAALLCVLGGASAPWLLLLDEPTNHLDLDAIAVLEAALQLFDGALLVASHDAAFLQAIGVRDRYAVGADAPGN